MARTIAIVQSRMSSQRLPEKALLPLAGRPLLWHVVTRVQQAKMLDAVVVATGDIPANDPIRQLCREHNWHQYSGSEDDVLARFYEAARWAEADQIVRISGDSPLASGAEIDRVVRYHLGCANDYSANCFPPRLPDGLDTEVVAMAALERAYHSATIPSDREHVTPWLRRNLPQHRWSSIGYTPDLSLFRLCVDTPADLEAMRAIMAIAGANVTWRTAIEALDSHPEIAALNQGVERNGAYLRQVKEEEAWATRLSS